jgi:HD-like signal output (HDOD) protein
MYKGFCHMNDSLLSKIKTLPPLPDTVTQIQRICADPESSVGDLIKVVEKDPMITANLLKAANSPFYGFSREIKTVSQAVSLFGMSTVKGLALSGAVKKLLSVDLEPYGITPQAFADISSLQNALMQTWYTKIDRSKMDILAVASFLQETGKIIIAQEIAKEGKAADFKAAIREGRDITSVEKEFLGETTATVTAAIFEHWRFEEGLIEAIKYSDSPLEAPEATAPYSIALCIVKTALQPLNTFGEEHFEQALLKARLFGLDEAVLLEALNTFKERMVTASHS